MRTFKILLCLLLIVSLLAGTFCACRGKGGKQPDTTPPDPGTSAGNSNVTGSGGEDDPNVPKELHAIDVLGERDLTGKTITFLARAGGNMWDVSSLYAEEYLAEAINDAVFNRNETLKNQYHFDIEIEPSGATSYPKRVENAILANSNQYDVVTACGYDMAELAVAGVLRDVSTMDALDLEESWWNTTLNAQLSIANALYYFSGDIICEDNMAVRCIFFNKPMADSIGVAPSDLYAMANEKRWTFEEMFKLAGKAYLNLDDEAGTSSGDQLGFICQKVVAGNVLMNAAGVQITSKNDEDEPILNSNFNYDILDSIVDYIESEGVLIADDALNPYKNGRVLFMTEVLGTSKKVRDWDIKSGILPLPMFTADQGSYYHYADGNCLNLLAIPTNSRSANKLDDVLFMMNAMCIESDTTLNPAFYDTCLRGRYAYDGESSDMLDIIFDSYYIENTNLYKRSWKDDNDKTIQDEIVEAFQDGNSVSTVIASHSSYLPKLISQTVTKLRDIAQAQSHR